MAPTDSDARRSERPPGRGVWHRQGPRRRDRGSGRGEHRSLRERQGWGDPTRLRASGAQARPSCPPRPRCRRTLSTRTLRPSAGSCALWPPTATSTGPRPTAGASAPPSGRCCTSWRCVCGRVRPCAGPPHPRAPSGTASEPSPGPSHLQGGECEEETIRFGLEALYVDSWARRRVYAAFKDALGSGMHHHLQVGGRGGGALGRCHADPSSRPSRPPEQRAPPGHLQPGPGAGAGRRCPEGLQDLPFREGSAPLSLLHCFGLARWRGLEEGWGRRLPRSRPSLCAPSTCTTRRPSEPGPRRAAACGTSGRTSCDRLSASSPVFFNRRPCNTLSLPGLIAFIFLMTKPKRYGAGLAGGHLGPPHAALWPLPRLRAAGRAEGGAFLRPCAPAMSHFVCGGEGGVWTNASTPQWGGDATWSGVLCWFLKMIRDN